MRYIIGFLSGVLGMLAGWFSLAMLVIAFAGHDQDGGIAMGAFFNIGPVGAVAGFIVGVVLFIRFGQTRAQPADPLSPTTQPIRRRTSPLYALLVLALTAALAWWGWYVFIRSPYLTHGFMTLTLQFKLPPGMPVPVADDVHINVYEGAGQTDVILGPAWHRKEGAADVILATATLSMKTSNRVIGMELPNVPEQQWRLNIPYDPDPTTAFSAWQPPEGAPASPIALEYQLGADQ